MGVGTLNDTVNPADTPETSSTQPPIQDHFQRMMEEVYQRREAAAPLEGKAWFEALFGEQKNGVTLLEPIDDTVNYAVAVNPADPYTNELVVEKYWKETGGFVGYDTMTVNLFDNEDDPADAEAEKQALLDLHAAEGLEAMMHEAERRAEQHHYLRPERSDPALFRHGPADRFQTLRERELVQVSQPVAFNPDSPILDDTQEMVIIAPDDDWFTREYGFGSSNEPIIDL
jgi:hypothetical protein